MGKPNRKHHPAVVKDLGAADDELEAADNGFFSDFAAMTSGSAPSTRKKARLEAEADECEAKYGTPSPYIPTDAVDMDDARSKAKAKIAQMVLQSALKQGDKKAARAVAERRLAGDTNADKVRLPPPTKKKHGVGKVVAKVSSRKLKRLAKFGEPKKRWSD